ncbi:MAG TPA: alpha-hydroxy acid oxidase [Candidatus Dormibacteraeota bacterium]|nr:alpha-hydroxy acid oxidase [Candidatus Dormibacteraeota bacterium]
MADSMVDKKTRPAPPLKLDDFEPAARAVLPQGIYDYIAGGSEDEAALRGNREAFARYRFRFKVLASTDHTDLSSELFGQRFRMPVHLAPTAIQRMAHPDGELAAYRAASEAGIAYALSTLASAAIEEVAAAASGPRWFQLYMHAERAVSAGFVERAVDAGYSAILLTVDLPKTGRRERDIRNAFSLPQGLRYANLDDRRRADPDEGPDPFAQNVNANTHPGLGWADLEWLVARTSLPVMVKGIVRSDDARHAVEAGARGLIVSNHGGRQLDYAIASLDALPEVVDAVGRDIPVLMDGGIRRGTDVLKALSLGAKGVLIGRPFLYALAVGGADAVSRMLAMLREEMEVSMTLLGVRRLSELSNDLVTRV